MVLPHTVLLAVAVRSNTSLELALPSLAAKPLATYDSVEVDAIRSGQVRSNPTALATQETDTNT